MDRERITVELEKRDDLSLSADRLMEVIQRELVNSGEIQSDLRVRSVDGVPWDGEG